ncbi:Membrane-associated phospholipid phosphatase [Rhynchospora pubera]|uniref:protein-tyrosine-phosphatase n=1 Tax=Rhynchospora pubera TaxID=906938 RepID=A0AAV8DK73_9POAL|nr:Membrane-associated phospholipid phosphatase [Rhynchospora pubera]
MGISMFVGTAATVFLIPSFCLTKAGLPLLTIPFLYTSFILFIITIVSHTAINLPLVLGKNPKTGQFPFWSILFFSPFLLFSQLYFHFKRIKRRGEPLYNEIYDGFYLGGWPRSETDMPTGDLSVIDCTCDLPHRGLIDPEDYICIGAFDTRSPLPWQIELAVRWACAKRDTGRKIYIHCAFGHGRSACVMCAFLVALGITESWKEAEKIICKKRPRIKMNRLHRSTLEEWSKIRPS